MVKQIITGSNTETLTEAQAALFGRELAFEKMKRDDKGLLVNTTYVFKDDGSIDWKRMIPQNYLVINKEYFERKQMQIPDSVEGLDDKQLLILLGGIKELAKIRGLREVQKRVVESGPDRAVVICRVEFIPNYETNGAPLIYEEVANATLANTNSFSQLFLETIASNRAFVRAVRNALRIDIVGSDELSTFQVDNADAESAGAAEPWVVLRETAKRASLKAYPSGFKTFEDFKQALIAKKVEGADEWNDWKEVPSGACFKLIGLLNKSSK